MRGLLFGAAFVISALVLDSGASAALTAEPSASLSAAARPVRGGQPTLAKAKKKKRSGGAPSSSKSSSDSDDSGSADDAPSKSSAASDDASKEDELLGGSKKKAAPARDDGGDGASAAKASDDGDAETSKAGGKSVETVSTKASSEEPSAASPGPALEFGVGAKALFRNLSWTADASSAGCSPCLGPYALTPGPETGLWLEFYPAALGTNGFAANVGLFGSFDFGFGVATTLANGANVATKFRDFLAGIKLRIPIGTFVPNVAVSYGQQVFEIAPQNPSRDIPQVAYSFVRPSLGARWLLTPTVSLDASAGYLAVLDPGSGANHIRSSSFFPNATSFGFDLSASVAYRLVGAVGLRGGVDLRQYVLDMNDKTQPTIGGGVDRYITAWAGVEVVLDGDGGAAASGDDQPVKPSKRRRRHHPEPKPDDETESSDDSSSGKSPSSEDE
jgi:hypothetical protein